jgi:hypothetical protein
MLSIAFLKEENDKVYFNKSTRHLKWKNTKKESLLVFGSSSGSATNFVVVDK